MSCCGAFCSSGLVFDSGRLVFPGLLKTLWSTTTAITPQGPISGLPHDPVQPSVRVLLGPLLGLLLGMPGVCARRGGLQQPRTRARFARTFLGSFWLGLSNLLSIAALALVYGTVFKVQDFSTYVVYLGIGLVVWNGMSAAIGSAPNLFEHNQAHVHNTNLNPIFYVLEEWAFQIQTFCNRLFWWCLH